MTYGEAMIYAKDNCIINSGIAIIKAPPHQPKMHPTKAAIYYNNKLYKYWLTQMSESISICKRELYLNYLLGRSNHEFRR